MLLDHVSIRIILQPDALRELSKPVNGEGGYQNLLRALQDAIDPHGVLILHSDLIERVSRCATQYGSGGFQSRLGHVWVDLVELAELFETIDVP